MPHFKKPSLTKRAILACVVFIALLATGIFTDHFLTRTQKNASLQKSRDSPSTQPPPSHRIMGYRTLFRFMLHSTVTYMT